MIGIEIYLEGGGLGKEGRDALRDGMSRFLGSLKAEAQTRRLKWRVIPCGGRSETKRQFDASNKLSADWLRILLVDAEEEVTKRPYLHLNLRDNWTLSANDEHRIHLMAQTMETWVVADLNALRAFYPRDLNETALPRANDLESVSKADIAAGLERATSKVQKGRYHKLMHGPKILALADAGTVRERCRHCDRLFVEVENLL